MLLRALADVALRQGVTPEALFEGEVGDFMTCDPVEVRMPLERYRKLFERAIALTGEPALGLRCGLYASESAFDLLAPLISHVPTLRHAVQEIQQFQSLAFEGGRLHLSERAGVARLRCDFPRAYDATDRSLAEFVNAGLLRMLRGFGCAADGLVAARFEHSRPAHYRSYELAFAGKARFSEPFTGIDFAAHLLDRKHLHTNPSLQGLVHGQAEQRLARLGAPLSLVDRLRAYLGQRAPAHVPDMSIAARTLGVSVRTLRRRLSEQQLSYRTLTQEAQRESACTMLRNPDFTLQAVADALGFSDAPSFHRAFKRWTGQTACEYRAGHSMRA